MTPLLTDAEHRALALSKKEWDLVLGGEYHKSLGVLADLATRLLSARAVPMETVAWRSTDTGWIAADHEKRIAEEKGKGDFRAYTDPLVLRSAAEAYTAGMREALALVTKNLGSAIYVLKKSNLQGPAYDALGIDLNNALLVGQLALTDTTTKEEGGEDADRN